MAGAKYYKDSFTDRFIREIFYGSTLVQLFLFQVDVEGGEEESERDREEGNLNC